MKKLFALILFYPTFLFAQLDIKLNLPATATLKPEIGLEMGYDKFSLEITNGLILNKWAKGTVTDNEGNEFKTGINRFGYNGTIRANYYFNPIETLDGWYISPMIKYRSQKIKFDDPIKNKRAGVALAFGRKGLIFDQLGYSVETGFGYWIINSYKNSSGESDPVYKDAFIFQNLLETLDKVIVPFNIGIFYRIGG
jgi:hypothetical protein